MSGIKETKLLAEIDPEMFELIQQEYNRQTGGLELIASEVCLHRSGSASAPRWAARGWALTIARAAAAAELHVDGRDGVPRQLPHEQVLGRCASPNSRRR